MAPLVELAAAVSWPVPVAINCLDVGVRQAASAGSAQQGAPVVNISQDAKGHQAAHASLANYVAQASM